MAISQVKDIEVPEGKTIIDIVPDEIILDNGKVMTDPVGSLSSTLTINAQIILADKDYTRQLAGRNVAYYSETFHYHLYPHSP